MERRIVGPGGVPILGGAKAGEPIMPVLDLTRVQESPAGERVEQRFRVPGVGVLYIDPGVIQELAKQIAPLIAAVILQASAQASENVPEDEVPYAETT